MTTFAVVARVNICNAKMLRLYVIIPLVWMNPVERIDLRWVGNPQLTQRKPMQYIQTQQRRSAVSHPQHRSRSKSAQ